MEYLLIACVAFVAGWKAADFVITATFMKILEQLKVTGTDLEHAARALGTQAGIDFPATETVDTAAVSVRIEQHQGCYYAYHTVNDEFVAQGDTPESLLGSMLQRLPEGSTIIVEPGQCSDIIELALTTYADSQKS